MLGEPRRRVAELVGEPGLLGDLGEDLRRRPVRLACAHQVEDAEFHNPVSTHFPARHGDDWPTRASIALD